MLKTAFKLLTVSLVSTASWAQSITIGQGNLRNATVTSSSNVTSGVSTLDGSGFLPNHNAASRFLSQATLGHNITDVNNLTLTGNEQWLNTQLNLPSSFSVRTHVAQMHQAIVDSSNLVVPGSTLQNTFVGDWHFDIAWFHGAQTAPDPLRWRVALALSEILVTSRNSTFKDNPYALGGYFDIMLKGAFGNYRSLIDSVTYQPAMGVYLTFMNNRATDATRQIYPDENYAREIMQLFTVGLYELNLDGTEKKDANGNAIPTYNNTDIANLAKVFTGLSWPDSRWFGDWEKNYWSYVGRMKFYAQDTRNPSRIVDAHEGGTKTFLGQTIVARPVAQGEQDIQDALNIVFNHPNTAPFVCRRLIQRLVTSNPSPAYIQRVASVFNNNGSGVRGDLKAVVKAILLDFEARDTSNPDLYSKNSRGHLREPFIRYMNIMKGLNLNNNNGPIRNVMFQVYDKLEQIPMWSPSVFNFFQPDYAPNGPVKNAGKYAPEFQLLNSQNLTGYMNALQRWIVSNNPTDWWGFFPTEKYKPSQDPGFDFSADFPLTRNDRLPELIDKYNMLFANGAISAQNQVFIRNAVAGLPYAESNGVINTDLADRRMRVLIYLILSSPDYLINR